MTHDWIDIKTLMLQLINEQMELFDGEYKWLPLLDSQSAEQNFLSFVDSKTSSLEDLIEAQEDMALVVKQYRDMHNRAQTISDLLVREIRHQLRKEADNG